MKGLLLCSKSDSGEDIGARDGRGSFFFQGLGRGSGLNLQGKELPSHWSATGTFFGTPCRLLFFSMSALLSSLF